MHLPTLVRRPVPHRTATVLRPRSVAPLAWPLVARSLPAVILALLTATLVPTTLAAQEPEPDWSALLSAGHDDADLPDPVAELSERIESGERVLSRDPDFGYLPSVLEALDIPLSSQILVFSRTSLQVDVIAPWAPRAIYFNDDIYVGYTVDGLVLEIASVDPDGGSVFYTIDQREDDVVLRQDDLTCNGCHETGMTGGVPGVLMRSYLTDRMGNTVTPIQERPVDDRTPMEKRFGGWYVTGSNTVPHAGNVRAEEMTHEIDQPDDYLEEFDVHAGGNLTSLEGRFDGSFYPGEGSDIVALLVLAHQTRAHNLITIAAEVAGEAEQERRLLSLGASGEVSESDLPSSTLDKVDFAVEQLVRGMLFYRAEPIGQVEGSSAYASDFSAPGPRDSKGRSLRDFSLDGRIFEHPMSFLVYSDAWDALPAMVKRRAYTRIHEILTGGDDPDFPLLDDTTRRRIFEILVDTKPEFASFIEAWETRPARP